MANQIDVSVLSRSQLKALETEHLQAEKDPQDFKEIWLNYARLERPKRLARVLLFLIEKAARGETTTYKDFAAVTGTDSFHENTHIIRLVGEICIANNWRKYTVLVKQEASNKVGSGFFTDHKIVANEQIRAQYEKTYEVECFQTAPPTAVEICTRLLEFIDKKNLGEFSS